VRRPTSFATGPALEEELGHPDPVGGVAPRGAAQVEDEPLRPVALQGVDVGPHLLRGRGREVGDADVARPALDRAALRGRGQDPLPHDCHVERVGARPEDAELDRRPRGAAQEPLGHHGGHRPGVPLVDALEEVARPEARLLGRGAGARRHHHHEREAAGEHEAHLGVPVRPGLLVEAELLRSR